MSLLNKTVKPARTNSDFVKTIPLWKIHILSADEMLVLYIEMDKIYFPTDSFAVF